MTVNSTLGGTPMPSVPTHRTRGKRASCKLVIAMPSQPPCGRCLAVGAGHGHHSQRAGVAVVRRGNGAGGGLEACVAGERRRLQSQSLPPLCAPPGRRLGALRQRTWHVAAAIGAAPGQAMKPSPGVMRRLSACKAPLTRSTQPLCGINRAVECAHQNDSSTCRQRFAA
jgi:hypothetical protein